MPKAEKRKLRTLEAKDGKEAADVEEEDEDEDVERLTVSSYVFMRALYKLRRSRQIPLTQ